nr:hypothetical protein [Actinoplanes polyasparticus]
MSAFVGAQPGDRGHRLLDLRCAGVLRPFTREETAVVWITLLVADTT